MAAKLQGRALTVARVVVLGLWAVGVVGIFVGPESPLAPARNLVFFLLAAHALESVYFIPQLKKLGRPLSRDVIPLAVYGSIHFLSVDTQPASRDSQPTE